MWTSEEIRFALRSTPVLIALTAQFSAMGGAAVTAFLLTKQLEAKYQAISEEEIAEARLFYKRLHKVEEFSDPISALEQYASRVDELGYSPEGKAQAVEEELIREDVEAAAEEVQNIFELGEGESGFDYEAEVRMRKPERPYLITSQEHDENEDEFEQSTLTYFEGDDVLLDSRDKPIPDPDMIVGDDNLLRFGVGSGDPKVVYVRNERLKMDFEILKSEGKYTEEVLGFLKHSYEGPRNRKFRLGRDE